MNNVKNPITNVVSSSKKDEEATSFTLTTSNGTMSYDIPCASSNITQYYCTLIKLLITFTADKLDPNLVGWINQAIETYNNETLNNRKTYHGRIDVNDVCPEWDDTSTTSPDISDDFEEESKREMTPWAIAAVKARMKRVSEVKKAIKTLPNVPELSLRVLSVEDDSEEDVLKAIAKYTGSSNNAAFITEHKLLTLPRIDAMELYTSLRLLEAIVAVKPHTSSVVATRTAAKSKRKQVKNPRIQITGLEKLNSNVGIIK